jgi:hypothetical protein
MRQDQHLQTIATRVTTTSALNPALTLCLMVCPLLFGLSGVLFYAGLTVPGSACICIASVPLLIACWQIVLFTLRDPNRLQREQHLENMLAIQNKIGVKEDGVVREIEIPAILTQNPISKEADSE